MFGAAARALSGVFECNARQDPSCLLPAGRYQPKIAQNNTVPTLWVSKTLPEMYLGPARPRFHVSCQTERVRSPDKSLSEVELAQPATQLTLPLPKKEVLLNHRNLVS